MAFGNSDQHPVELHLPWCFAVEGILAKEVQPRFTHLGDIANQLPYSKEGLTLTPTIVKTLNVV